MNVLRHSGFVSLLTAVSVIVGTWLMLAPPGVLTNEGSIGVLLFSGATFIGGFRLGRLQGRHEFASELEAHTRSRDASGETHGAYLRWEERTRWPHDNGAAGSLAGAVAGILWIAIFFTALALIDIAGR